MKDALVWLKLVLVLGGCVVIMVGLLWYRGGNLLGFFGHNIFPEQGFKVAMTGLGMLLVGLSWVYLAG